MPNPRGKISYQELMRLKRSERPASVDWERFQQELRIKQRKLLQKQPVEGPALEPEFWRRFRKTAGYCCATLSCGAIGWLTVSTSVVQVATVPEAPAEAVAPKAAAPAAQPVFVAKSVPAPAPVQQFREVEPARAVEAKAAPAKKESIASRIASIPAFFSITSREEEPHLLGKSVVDLSSLATFASVTSDAIENEPHFLTEDTQNIVARYAHPLSAQGFSYPTTKSPSGGAINRLTSLARKANLLEDSNRLGKKLDLVSIRF